VVDWPGGMSASCKLWVQQCKHIHDLQQISRAHRFMWKILPNSVGQFLKFCGLLWQNRPNSAAHCSLPFVRKLSSILFRNFSYRKAGVVLSCARNIQRKLSIFFSFRKCSLSSCIVYASHDFAVLWQLLVGPTVLGSSVWIFPSYSMTKIASSSQGSH